MIKEFMHRLLSGRAVPDDYLPSLPTEAQWEYACKAGIKHHDKDGLSTEELDGMAWFRGNSKGKAQPVGTKNPNALGLFDMLGNVWEWCEDWYEHNYYSISETEVDPKGPSSGWAKVIRGGSWKNDGVYCRSSNRFKYRPWTSDYTVGFRLVLIPR